jgi:hypothetical protein
VFYAASVARRQKIAPAFSAFPPSLVGRRAPSLQGRIYGGSRHRIPGSSLPAELPGYILKAIFDRRGRSRALGLTLVKFLQQRIANQLLLFPQYEMSLPGTLQIGHF